MYANNKGWNVGNIDVDVKMNVVQTEGKSIKKITKAVKFGNSLDESQVQRLIQIGSKRSISKLLEEPIEMAFETY